MSWTCILAGHGIYPDIGQRTGENQNPRKIDITPIIDGMLVQYAG